MNSKITKTFIDKTSYDESRDGKKHVVWDSEMTGFGLRLYPSGKKSFVLSYRHNGVKREYTIGQYGKITLDQARKLAQKRMGDVADGKDPVIQRQSSKKRNELTVEKAFKDFVKKHAKIHTKNWQETKRIFEKDIIPALGSAPLDEVKKGDVLKILDAVMDRKAGIMANRTLAAIRKFFNWCIQRGMLEHSPAHMIALPAKKRSRDRVLSDSELKEIWSASKLSAYPFGEIIRFLILTGQRRGEVSHLEWNDLDFEGHAWSQPREKTKADREHVVPLSSGALDLLNKCHKLGSYVFSSTGQSTFQNFSREKKVLDSKIDINAWTIHDIRRTVASGMAKIGIEPHVIEKSLNHSSGRISGVAGIYNRYDYLSERKDAFDQWAEHLNSIIK